MAEHGGVGDRHRLPFRRRHTMSITLAPCKMLGVESTERRVRGAVAADGQRAVRHRLKIILPSASRVVSLLVGSSA
jgi:hypothetical protein